MAKMKSKGTVLARDISSVYTAIPQIISINKSGEASETYDSRTLDGSAGLTKDPTGFVTPPTIAFDMFYDAANSVHAGLKTLMRAPTATNFKITYTDAGPVSEIWSVVGVSMDETIEGANGVKASVTLTTSGTAS